MIISAAQTKPYRRDVAKNLQDHYLYANIAASNGANLIAFPEMSITGYERDEAKQLSFLPNDSRLDKLRYIAQNYQILIIAGAPVLIENELFIGSFILKPDGLISIYVKQFLHPGEEGFFNSSLKYNPIIEIKNEKMSLAICADIDNPIHPENACKNKTTIYIPSIFFTPNGISGAHHTLAQYAKKYSMNVLMANFTGQSWGINAGGGSAFWNNEGILISSMNSSESGILIAEKVNDYWSGKVIYM